MLATMAKEKDLVGLNIAFELGLRHCMVVHFSVLITATQSELQATWYHCKLPSVTKAA